MAKVSSDIEAASQVHTARCNNSVLQRALLAVVAQLVVQHIRNVKVGGSSPLNGTSL